MSIPVEDKKIYKGQHKDYMINVADASGQTEITGFTIVFQVKQTVSGDPIIEKTTAKVTEIKITDGSKGIAELYLLPTDTLSLTMGKYYYDIWITDSNSKTRPILCGHFWIRDAAPSLVSMLRKRLDEAGELRVQTVPDELVYPATLNKLFVTRTRIKGVIGVWAFTDTDHTETNYYTGGGFNSSTGEIWLGTEVALTNQYLRVSYLWESGVDDDSIEWHLDESRNWVIQYTGVEFTYGNTVAPIEKSAESMALAAAVLGCILTVNGANVAQLGYNFRLHEFEIQTKLWGEGMIAEALFGVYIQQINWWLSAIGKAGQVYVATPPTSRGKYTINNQLNRISPDDSGIEGSEH